MELLALAGTLVDIVVFFLLKVFGYVGSLGNLNFDPFLLTASTDVARPETSYRITAQQETRILLGMIAVITVVLLLWALEII
jgi:hypothetical protein